MSSVRKVSVLSTGSVQIRPQHVKGDGSPLLWWLMTSRRWSQELPINVYVIEHENGLVLFDTGEDRRAVTDPGYFPGGFAGLIFRRLAKFRIGQGDTLTEQLARIGYDAGDVTTAIVSHLHQDHIGGLRELPNARILVSAAEWTQLDASDAEVKGFLLDHIRVPSFNWTQITPEPSADASIAPFTHSHDVFGDGSLLLVPTPGHTAGSLSLLVERGSLAPLLLVGDLTYDVDVMASGHIPGLGERAQVRRSSRAVLELQKRRDGLVVLAAHDPAASDMLARATPVAL